jgi:hypothetical protein
MDQGFESLFRSCCSSLNAILYEFNLVTRDVRVSDSLFFPIEIIDANVT